VIRGMVRLAAGNPVLLNLIFAVVCIWGVLAWRGIPKEEFPQVDVDQVGVWVVWPGASPEDIEDLVVRPLEDALADVEGVEHRYGEALEGFGQVTMEFVRGTDVDEARAEVDRAVAGLDTLPEGARAPFSRVLRLLVPITHVALLGDPRQVDLAEQLADELRAFSGVKEVEILGASERRIEVSLDPARAAALGIGPGEVAAAIEAASAGAPLGDLEIDGQRVGVRASRPIGGAADAATAAADVAAVPLRVPRAGAGGTLRVGDLGRVEEVWEPAAVRRYVNGQPAIVLQLRREATADSLAVVEAVTPWVAGRAEALPPGLGLVAYDDSARVVEDRIQILALNGLVGVLLVAGCLVLFVGRRNALLVLWGMPVAYLGAVGLIAASGNTVNVISTFALLLVTGIIVDDAVIIVENVQRHLEQGKDRLTAALDGTTEVAGAVGASTLTTCLAFAPMAMLEGAVGRVMAIIPAVVIFSLGASLLEAFFILPGHLAHYARERGERGENRATRALKRLYSPAVQALTHPRTRWIALGGLGLAFGGVVALTGLMRTTLTTPGLPYYALVNLDLPPSATLAQTRAALESVEARIRSEGAPLTAWYAATAGRQFDPQDFPRSGARYGQVKIGFHNDPEIFEAVPRFLEGLRQQLGAEAALTGWGIRTLEGGPPAGRDIDVRVRGRDPEAVMAATGALLEHLAGRPGVLDALSDATPGEQQLQVEVDPLAAARFGLREAQIVGAARAALDGVVAVELPVDERATEIRVRLAGLDGADLERVRDLPLITPAGTIRLRQVAEVRRGRGLERIQRVDGLRSVRVSANVDPAVSTPELERAALDEAFAAIQARWPGVEPFYGGVLADTEESFAQLPGAAALATLLIYAVLAVQFRSYLQPLIILSAIPMGVAGMILGLFALGMELSFTAAIGGVGLIGIVVNDSLVLVDFINRARREGVPPREAVIQASLTRLRPILITTVTTVLGLGPLALGVAGEEPLLAPMAVAISFGLAFATALTLVAVPVLYLVLEDLGRLVRRAPEAA
jgi:multidrug efflux pump subunit AcrB